MSSDASQPLAGKAEAIGVGPVEMSPYAVKLPLFEGPLDLLLHLIRLNEVEITDIPVAKVAEQYIQYLDLMHELNLDVAGEYLVMAATLAWIKSRMLLPVNEEEEEESVDPRAELVAGLLEYQRFKEAAGELGERPLLGREVFGALPQELPVTPEGEREIEVGLFELVDAFQRALKSTGPSGRAHEVETETITVRDRMIAMMGVLEKTEALEFMPFLFGPEGQAPSRPVLIATFLAMLELSRLAVLRVYQGMDEGGSPRGPIHLRRAVAATDPIWLELVAELA